MRQLNPPKKILLDLVNYPHAKLNLQRKHKILMQYVIASDVNSPLKFLDLLHIVDAAEMH
jgi:hypothetical protein